MDTTFPPTHATQQSPFSIFSKYSKRIWDASKLSPSKYRERRTEARQIFISRFDLLELRLGESERRIVNGVQTVCPSFFYRDHYSLGRVQSTASCVAITQICKQNSTPSRNKQKLIVYTANKNVVAHLSLISWNLFGWTWEELWQYCVYDVNFKWAEGFITHRLHFR